MRKRIILLAVSTIISFSCYSQIVFEKGYFINNSNQKVDCLIKNIDWRDNPSEFEYKLFEGSESKKINIQEVKEFEIYNVSKYIRALVKLDRSSDNMPNIDTARNPLFHEELLFLKVLIDGKGSLFLYKEKDLTRFFYKRTDSEIEQLVYKRFVVNDRVFENNYFRQQLFLDLKCEDIGLKDVEFIRYKKREIERLFVKYNVCNRSSYLNFETMQKKDLFNLTLRPGFNFSSLSVQNSDMSSWEVNFGSQLNFRFGIETEFVLPFNKSKWATIIEPTFQYFNSEKRKATNSVSGGIIISEVNYKSIEVPVGIRHYFFLNSKSKIFVDVSFLFDFSSNSKINYTRKDGSPLGGPLTIDKGSNLAFGMGYSYKSRYNLELRYQTSREILDHYLYFSSDYKTVSVIFGYTLF